MPAVGKASVEAVHHAAVVVASASQREPVVEAEGAGACRQLPRVVQDEVVDAVRGVRIRRVEPLMHQQRLVQPVGLEDRVAERPVLLEAVRRLHPVQHELAVRLPTDVVAGDRAEGELVADERGVERMWRHGTVSTASRLPTGGGTRPFRPGSIRTRRAWEAPQAVALA
jgi:hypothetical protein